MDRLQHQQYYPVIFCSLRRRVMLFRDDAQTKQDFFIFFRQNPFFQLLRIFDNLIGVKECLIHKIDVDRHCYRITIILSGRLNFCL